MDGFGINYLTMVNMQLNKEIKPNVFSYQLTCRTRLIFKRIISDFNSEFFVSNTKLSCLK